MIVPSCIFRASLILLSLGSLLWSGLGMRFDCCQSKFTDSGVGCETPTVYDNETYYCVEVSESCSSCQLGKNLSSYSCYQCCATAEDVCEVPFSYISTSSWSEY